jgi:hypothetical protein
VWAICLAAGLACSSSPSGADADGGGTGGAGGANSGGSGGTAGTGGSGATTDGAAGWSSDAGTAAEQACADYAKNQCQKYSDCVPWYLVSLYGDLDACVRRETATVCAVLLRAPGTADTPSKIAACAAARRTANCEEWFEREPAVNACLPKAGPLPTGTACATSSQCQSAYCAVSFGATCGICTATVPAGGACVSGEECVSNLRCVDGKCGFGGKEGDSCTYNSSCHFGLGCVNGHCGAQAKAGDSCTLSCGYYADLNCINGVCVPTQYGNVGDACEPQAYKLCRQAGSCQISSGSKRGICVAAATDGQPCDSVNGPSCIPRAVCELGICKVRDPATCK